MANDLTRITVNLVPRSAKALEEALALADVSQTDAVNEAVRLYRDYWQARANGRELMWRNPDGSVEKIHIV